MLCDIIKLSYTYNFNAFEKQLNAKTRFSNALIPKLRDMFWVDHELKGIAKGWSNLKEKGTELLVVSQLPDTGPFLRDTNKTYLLKN